MNQAPQMEELGGSNLHTPWDRKVAQRWPLLPAAVGLIVGISIQYSIHLPLPVWLGLPLIGMPCIFFLNRRYPDHKNHLLLLLVFFCAIVLGAIRFTAYTHLPPNHISHLVGPQRTMATIRGTIASAPRRCTSETWKFAHFRWASPSSSFYMQLSHIETENGWQEVTGKVRAYLSDNSEDPGIGDSIEAYCWLSRFGPSLNPGQFDLRKYLASKNIHVAASIPSAQSIRVLHKTDAHIILRLKNHLQNRSLRAFSSDNMDETDPGLLVALLLGQRSAIDTATVEAFRKTGLAHFISLSGLHLGIIAGFVWWLGRAAGLLKRRRSAITLIIISLYVFLLPPRAPTTRAAIICAFFLLSTMLTRRHNPLNTLALAAGIMLIIRPADLFSPGWQLSFSAVFGIIVLYQPIKNRLSLWLYRYRPLEPKTPRTQFHRLTTAFLDILSVGIAAQLACSPILLYHFGTMNLFAPSYTALLLPLVTLTLILGFLNLALYHVLGFPVFVLPNILDALENLLATIVRFLARIPIGNIQLNRIQVVAAGLICIAAILLAIRLRSPVHRRRLSWAASATLVIVLSLLHVSQHFRSSLYLHCLAVGKGQSILIQTPERKTILLDAGSMSINDVGSRVIIPTLKSRGVRKLDALMLSHDDLDHLNAAPEITAAVPTKRVYVNQAFLQATQTSNTARILARLLELLNDKTFELQSKAKVRILWPDERMMTDPTFGDNDKSQVVLIEYANRRVLVCGDIEWAGQQCLLANYPQLQVDILVMPHHGTTRNLHPEFIARLQPEAILVSCDQTQYETTAIKKAEGIPIYYTCWDGQISVEIKKSGDMDISTFCNHQW